MSLDLMNRVWRMEIPSTPKIVLLSLADQANEAGVCWPSQPQIARRCSLTDRAVRDQLAWLEDAKVICRDVRAGIGTTFTLTLPIEEEPRNPLPPRKDIPPRNQLPATPEQYSGHPGTTFRQIISKHQEPSDIADKPPVSSKAADPCPHQAIIDLYHQALPSGRHVRSWTDTRKAKLRARWKEEAERQSLDWWAKFFGYIAESDFLTGKTSTPGRRPFEIDLEWIVTPSNFVKILEGKYENGQTAITPTVPTQQEAMFRGCI